MIEGRRFWVALGLIAVLAACARLAYLLTIAPPMGLSDAFWFAGVSQQLARGNGFVLPLGGLRPTALHPPLYAIWLTLWRELGVTGSMALRSTSTLLGGTAVFLAGLVGRRLSGPVLGLACAALVAVHPLFITADGTLLSEPLYAVIIAAVMLAALRLHDRPAPGRAVLLGVFIGLAALTRSEAILLLAFLVLPVVRRRPARIRWRLFAVATACAAVTVAPWVIRNWSVFDRPVLSNNFGVIVGQTNNRPTYYDINHMGGLGACVHPFVRDEAKDSALCSRQGREYAVRHVVRWPVVVPVRVLRELSFWTHPFDPGSSVAGRHLRVYQLGIGFYYLLLAPAILGVLALRRARRPVSVLIAPIIMVTFVAAITWGNVRLRAPGDLALTLLAAAGIVELRCRWLASRRRAQRVRASDSPASPGGDEGVVRDGMRIP